MHQNTCKWFQKYRKRYKNFTKKVLPYESFHDIMIEICELKLSFPPLRHRILGHTQSNIIRHAFHYEFESVENLPEAVFNALVFQAPVTLQRVKTLMKAGWTLEKESTTP